MPNLCPYRFSCIILIPVYLRHTCGEHARVGVSWRETHVLLDASARTFGHPLDRQFLGLLQYPPPGAALVMHSLHCTVKRGLKGLQLGGGLSQQETCHKLTQHWWILILLEGGLRGKINEKSQLLLYVWKINHHLFIFSPRNVSFCLLIFILNDYLFRFSDTISSISIEEDVSFAKIMFSLQPAKDCYLVKLLLFLPAKTNMYHSDQVKTVSWFIAKAHKVITGYCVSWKVLLWQHIDHWHQFPETLLTTTV